MFGQAGGSLAGTVSDEGIRPIAGAVVIANREGLPAASGRATSAADGTYQITGLPVGSYAVCAQVPGGGFVDVCEWATPTHRRREGRAGCGRPPVRAETRGDSPGPSERSGTASACSLTHDEDGSPCAAGSSNGAGAVASCHADRQRRDRNHSCGYDSVRHSGELLHIRRPRFAYRSDGGRQLVWAVHCGGHAAECSQCASHCAGRSEPHPSDIQRNGPEIGLKADRNMRLTVKSCSIAAAILLSLLTQGRLCATPGVVSATPSSGIGFTQSFALVYSSSGGYASLTNVQVNFSSPLSGASACYLAYVPGGNYISLVNDAGTAFGAGSP